MENNNFNNEEKDLINEYKHLDLYQRHNENIKLNLENELTRLDLLNHRVKTFLELKKLFDNEENDLPFDTDWLEYQIFQEYFDEIEFNENDSDNSIDIDFKPTNN